MRTWVCRARFAADRVFAIDRMKRAATLLGLRISSTGNSEGESLEGENLARQTSTRVNKTGPPRWICLFEASSREVVFGRGSEETDFKALLSLRLPFFGVSFQLQFIRQMTLQAFHFAPGFPKTERQQNHSG